MENSKVLKEKMEGIASELRTIGDKVKEEKRNFYEQEKEQMDTLLRTRDELAEKIETLERIEKVDGLNVSERRAEVLDTRTRGYADKAEERNKAYSGWFYHRTPRQKPEYWRAAERLGIDIDAPIMRFDWQPWEQRTGQVEGTNSAGGYTVAVDNALMREIDIALKYYGDVLNVATVVTTPNGAPLPYPLTDDTGNPGEVSAEQASINQIDMTFAKNTLSAYKYDSGFIKVSWELLQDSILDLSAHIAKMSGIRIGRKLNTDIMVTGPGNGSGTSVVSAATLGATSGSTLANGPLYSDIVALYESVDYAYQQEMGCGWLFSQNFRKYLRNMVDTVGRPLWLSHLEQAFNEGPGTLEGEPFYINNAMASWAANNKVALFGDLKKIIVRRVSGDEGGFNVLRLNERFADTGMVAFLTWGRFDAILSDAGQHPVKYLAAPAS